MSYSVLNVCYLGVLVVLGALVLNFRMIVPVRRKKGYVVCWISERKMRDLKKKKKSSSKMDLKEVMSISLDQKVMDKLKVDTCSSVDLRKLSSYKDNTLKPHPTQHVWRTQGLLPMKHQNLKCFTNIGRKELGEITKNNTRWNSLSRSSSQQQRIQSHIINTSSAKFEDLDTKCQSEDYERRKFEPKKMTRKVRFSL
ncbi:unnamed protein product [Moneuplotes crassus]|uniref:Uncharacterized protein n=1 Tax=Euplotes crassus TaxID=5936 RepID=A0AAD1XZE0_EUPCR|nr:unnamed protein product [Moneuplotes crassus]